MSTDIAALMQSLYKRFGQLPGIYIELQGELIAIAIENRCAKARIFLQGAQLSEYGRHEEPPIIWLSDQCQYRDATPLRGGIPICWPWFGDLSKNPQAIQQQIRAEHPPAHGFARQLPWELNDIQCFDNHTELSMTLEIAAHEQEHWPYASRLTAHFHIGQQLSVTLTVKNLSPEPVCWSGALHSYFAASNIYQVSLEGLEDCHYIDCMDSWQQRQQHGPVVFEAETDRIYEGATGHIQLLDPGWQRRIKLSSEGSHSAVIWNPWQEKAKRLSQFADDAFEHMLCIETANAGQDYIKLASEQAHRLGFTLSCDKL